MKKKTYAIALALKGENVFLVLLCFLFSIKLFSQSFTDNPNVYISEGTLVLETKIPTIELSEKSNSSGYKIFVNEGTTITGIESSEITQIITKTIKRKQNEKNHKIKVEKLSKEKTLKKQKIDFLLNTNNSKQILLSNSLKATAVIANQKYYFSKTPLFSDFRLVIVPNYYLKHNGICNINNFKFLLNGKTFSIRPPPSHYIIST